MSEVKTFNPPTLVFTDSAVARVKQLIEEDGNLNLSLRVFITGGGCSGFQYGFSFDEEINEDDMVIEKKLGSDEKGDESGADRLKAVRLLIDPMSYQYLVGGEIDYKSDEQGEQFIIRNPNAKTTCGCGSSFGI